MCITSGQSVIEASKLLQYNDYSPDMTRANRARMNELCNTRAQLQFEARSKLYPLQYSDYSKTTKAKRKRQVAFLMKVDLLLGDMFLIVSAVDQEESVSHMIDISNQIIECKMMRKGVASRPIPMLFVLNKIDLPRARWQVDYDEVNFFHIWTLLYWLHERKYVFAFSIRKEKTNAILQ